MRIIAGKFRSRRLAAPGDLKLRPTGDQLRETLFNVLGPSIEGSVFIDVFAGTGAVGIEALSRGASRVIFIEKHHATGELIRKNLRAFEAEAEICEGGALRELKQLVSRGVFADFIFADPPYADVDSLRAVLDFVAQREILAPGAIVIAEHAARAKMPEATGTLQRTRELKQGDSALSFYRR
jgi:16S rRNA (guanine966-N2)-methyltransferase